MGFNMTGKEDLLKLNSNHAKEKIIRFIRMYMIELKRCGAIVGLSGGLDSCVILKLCIEAVGCQNVRAVIMPERDSDPLHIRDAKRFAKSLSVKYTVKHISPLLWWLGVYRLYPPTFLFSKKLQARFVRKSRNKISEDLGKDIFIANLNEEEHPGLNRGKAFYRIKHRLRSNILFYYSELYNMLYVGTSNKSEIMTGFFVKYGDNIADIMPLSFLYKSQVKKLALSLDIESQLIDKPPSPDLIPGLLDEEILGLTYEKLDTILSAIEHNYDDDHIVDTFGPSKEDILRVRSIIKSSEYLRTWPINLNP